jgi:hypothetical protein
LKNLQINDAPAHFGVGFEMMTTRIPDNPETKFDRSSWLTLAFVVFVLVYNLAMLAYRFTLPTDGWVVNEATELGFNYIENLMSAPSGLQPGDNVIAVDGYPAVSYTHLTLPTTPYV